MATAMSAALNAKCHCGAVQISIAVKPDYLNECNCSLCHSHGVWWGYFAPVEVQVVGETKAYGRADRAEPAVNVHFCPTCGCTTHWTLTPVFTRNTGIDDRMGVNMRLVDRPLLSGIELRYPDGKHWNGIGQWDFVREAEIL
jgi:hypothetical protein